MKTDTNGNPLLTQYSEEGFIDCVLKITDLVETKTHYRFHLVGSYKGELVGMNVVMVKVIEAGFDAKMNLNAEHVYKSGVIFSRSGSESDRLITALSALFGKASKGLRMLDEASFTAIALHQGDINVAEEQVKLKLFGRDAPPSSAKDYYETFFNLDLKNRMVYWNEKDQEYRAPLIKALSVLAKKVN